MCSNTTRFCPAAAGTGAIYRIYQANIVHRTYPWCEKDRSVARSPGIRRRRTCAMRDPMPDSPFEALASTHANRFCTTCIVSCKCKPKRGVLPSLEGGSGDPASGAVFLPHFARQHPDKQLITAP